MVAMAAWNSIKNCMRYSVGMSGAILIGISWQDAGYVLEKLNFKVNSLLMGKLQKLEDMAIASQGKEGTHDGKAIS